MQINIDDKICDEYVYEVTIKVEAGKVESFYQTTFNRKQVEVAVKRALKALKIEDYRVKRIIISPIQKLGKSQIK